MKELLIASGSILLLLAAALQFRAPTRPLGNATIAILQSHSVCQTPVYEGALIIGTSLERPDLYDITYHCAGRTQRHALLWALR